MDGDSVNFTITVRNPGNSPQKVKLRLIIDNTTECTLNKTIKAKSTTNVVFHWWLATPWYHTWTVELLDDNNLKLGGYSGYIEVARDYYGLYSWVKVNLSSVKLGSNVTLFVTLKNSKDYEVEWPICVVDGTGNILWPKYGKVQRGVNYTLSSDGHITVYANRTAHILASVGPITKNTILYLRIGGTTVAYTGVTVTGNTPYLQMTGVSCRDLFLRPTVTLDYAGSVDCKIGFFNPHNRQVSIQLRDSKVLVDFPVSHSGAVISRNSTTAFPAHENGYVNVKFSASTSDFTAFAEYWVYGYYDLPITIKLHLTELMNNKYKHLQLHYRRPRASENKQHRICYSSYRCTILCCRWGSRKGSNNRGKSRKDRKGIVGII